MNNVSYFLVSLELFRREGPIVYKENIRSVVGKTAAAFMHRELL